MGLIPIVSFLAGAGTAAVAKTENPVPAGAIASYYAASSGMLFFRGIGIMNTFPAQMRSGPLIAFSALLANGMTMGFGYQAGRIWRHL